ncbi:MAG TPA: LysE family translocator [Candidatus Thermoplasmatota archaeon]|nr:LysE family translocator [Candidatus Thermoplasmatota archaeon]
MTDAALLGAFLLLTLGILIVPGPDVLYVMARSLGQGKRAGLLSALGIGAGVLVHTVLAAFGLSRLFIHVPAAYMLVKYAGVAYLLYLAFRILRDRSDTVVAGVPRHDSAHRLVGQAFLSNLLNPKAALFFVAVLPQFATQTNEALFAELLSLGLMVVALSVAVNALYALLAARVADYFRRSERADKVQKWVSAGTLGAIAVIAARAAVPTDS